ncbi:hypothetical protein HER10_EVM0008944 [Colletotrichum scovillei]|uniref:Alpha/beta-hydrolase n=1 Tax=Colletotrichum scovillei TaxID=1209932 RepID=A0A9P7UEM8_9PEZI|nr:uncharacterized protein HER10_EVM0008944 [Colletotrichum scovillei]KAF4783340.1 hypothetical protein HER10_EVM0008944 [Colletotrichum scovillei]KAG7053021.1 alpha/beta-hydrolase [Colletotrichum scovillei]KAG7071315.1 alpha/beta-hydrolase [Colletotrichum scovillei]KAG7079533.1 alpha/beta-hydrolase [Colletotrichum scovillei]
MNPHDNSRFAEFKIVSKIYKVIEEHSLEVNILYINPTVPSPAPRPVLFRLHGGGLVGGSSLCPPFFAPWILQLAKKHNAVIISPDYRLIPESTVQNALDDVHDCWAWTHQSLPRLLEVETGIRLDLGKVFTTGDSAGGYLAIQLALSYPDEMQAVQVSYPLVDVERTNVEPRLDESVFDQPPYPRATFEQHVARMRQAEHETGRKAVVSKDDMLSRADIMWTFVQHGLASQFFPKDQRTLFPFYRLQDGARLSRGGLVVWHAEGDSVVKVEASYRLQELLTKLDPELNFRLDVRDGEHGFDHYVSIDDAWVSESLKGIVASWLG